MSAIEWTEQTWNPTTGCTKVSPGCKHCYAEKMARRLNGMGVSAYKDVFDLALHPDRLEWPLRRKKPTMYFVNSMSDLFHEGIPDEFLDQAISVMRQTPQHTYQILTKRSDRLPQYFRDRDCPRNVWLGVSVEDRKHGVPRIDHLRLVDARIRFLSIEPLLEHIGEIDLTGIHWVIIGGESGSKARTFDVSWARSIINQCRAAGVPVFMKQLGSHPRGWCAWHTSAVLGKEEADKVRAQGEDSLCVHYEAHEQGQPCEAYGRRCMMIENRKGADMTEWPDDLRVREFPA